MNIIKKSFAQIEKIRVSGQYLTELLHIIYQAIEPGMTLRQVEEIAIKYVDQHHLIAAFHKFNGFPAYVCTSVNDCVVHGIPDRTILQAGDLLKVDIGINYRGAISDAAFSIVVGGAESNPKAQHLVDTAKGSLDAGLDHVRIGNFLASYSEAVSDYVVAKGCSVIKTLTGHGVGVNVHEEPHIYNYPHPSGYKVKFKAGMVVALEPIIAYTSDGYVEDKANKRNLYTNHGDLGAQWEYTVALGDNGPEVLAGIQHLSYF